MWVEEAKTACVDAHAHLCEICPWIFIGKASMFDSVVDSTSCGNKDICSILYSSETVSFLCHLVQKWLVIISDIGKTWWLLAWQHQTKGWVLFDKICNYANNLMCMFLVCGRKLDNTHTGTERTSKLYKKITEQELNLLASRWMCKPCAAL